MKILVIGSGGREHAILNSLTGHDLYFTGTNAAMSKQATNIEISEMDNDGLLEFALHEGIDLTVVGPEAPLKNGVVDVFEANGLRIFGPTQAAAKLEWSKEYAKEIMMKYGVPTAAYESFTDLELAKAYLADKEEIVIKYDGLAAGKGVVVCENNEQALSTIEMMFSSYGDKVVIEEFLDGYEFSLMAFVSNDKVYPMQVAQDHKRAFDNDEGPNTGGMGAYSPVPIVTDTDIEEATLILNQVAKGMMLENNPFKGILYGGFIKTEAGVKVIEFNARFGDPETEVVLPRLVTPLVDVFEAMIDNREVVLEWSSEYTLGVVMASKGYPTAYEKGFEIINPSGIHMGTKLVSDKVYTNGGRVLFVLGKGSTLEEAQKDAYQKVSEVECSNLFYRTDIGNNSL